MAWVPGGGTAAKVERGAELSLAGGETSRNRLGVSVCFWFCPHLYGHFWGKWSVDLCRERGQETLVLAVGKEKAGQVPQTGSWQSQMCLKRRKNEIGKGSGLQRAFSLSFPACLPMWWMTSPSGDAQ